jgi:hypothetical protein
LKPTTHLLTGTICLPIIRQVKSYLATKGNWKDHAGSLISWYSGVNAERSEGSGETRRSDLYY